MRNLKPNFKAALLATTLALITAGLAQADESFEVNEEGIATCEGNGNARASRGLLSTQFANKMWSHFACGKWDEAYEILEQAPKMDMDEYPSAAIPRELRTPFEQCYFGSFAYDGLESYHARQTDSDGNITVKHGVYRLKDDKFSDIEAAVTYACAAGF